MKSEQNSICRLHFLSKKKKFQKLEFCQTEIFFKSNFFFSFFSLIFQQTLTLSIFLHFFSSAVLRRHLRPRLPRNGTGQKGLPVLPLQDGVPRPGGGVRDVRGKEAATLVHRLVSACSERPSPIFFTLCFYKNKRNFNQILFFGHANQT